MNYILHLEDNLLQIKGATKVISSTQTQAVIQTGDCALVISGTEIEVKSLNLDDGIVCLYGKFGDIKLSHAGGKRQPFLKRIFK